MRLPEELGALAVQIAEWAREYGLDFWETEFEVVSWDEMNQLAAYDGFPIRYPHWRFGMAYERRPHAGRWESTGPMSGGMDAVHSRTRVQGLHYSSTRSGAGHHQPGSCHR